MKGTRSAKKSRTAATDAACTAVKQRKVASSATSLTVKLDGISLFQCREEEERQQERESRFEKLLDGLEVDGDVGGGDAEEKETCILSQDFFCTPDYITPDVQQLSNNFEFDKEDFPCPESPVKTTKMRNKRNRQADYSTSTNSQDEQPLEELKVGRPSLDRFERAQHPTSISQKKENYVSQSAVALRCRVMPPPCIRNPFLKESEFMNLDIFCDRKLKFTGLSHPVNGGDGLSRYHTDFHEIEKIGYGSFSLVFKALRRIDGCMYAVKHSIRQLHDSKDRRRALMEVQALAALGYHQNIVGYHSSWFEDEKLYIQMELCDHSLSVNKFRFITREKIFEALYQIAKALQFTHENGIAHLDVKPDNIYVKNGLYKLGDFGFATRINKELPIEEGDSRYMPLEILNENYDHLDKVDIFSLGAAIYELAKGSPLPESGSQFSNLRDGKISLLPGYSVQFQNLLKAMIDPNPLRRPSAKEVVENPLFDKVR